MRRFLVVLATLAVVPLLMAARPGTEFQLETQLSGQNVRWTMADGGKSGIFTLFDAGMVNNFGCVLINNAKTPQRIPLLNDGGISPLVDGGAPPPVYTSIGANVIRLTSLLAVNYCVRPSAFSPVWDGGCNTTPTDENYGQPLAAGSTVTIVPESAATTLCAITDSGFIQLPACTVQ